MKPYSDQESPVTRRARVLVVDDEVYILKAWKKILEEENIDVHLLDSGLEAVSMAEELDVDVLILDIRMPNISGLDILQEIKARRRDVEVVIMTAYASIDTALQAIKAGAYDYLTKPFENIEAVALTVRQAIEHKRLRERSQRLENMLDVKTSFEGLVGSSRAMMAVYRIIDSVAYSSSTVLIQGESGTGKELVARAIHQRSPRRDRPFVAVNCSALSEHLLESELFGHAKGAFTGAVGAKKGLFEVANHGSLFLDEIGEVMPQVQVKLLRVLQEGEFRRVGAAEVQHVDVRTIAATNADLLAAMRRGDFREDLFYRLNVITISMPPLRERLDDIPLLAHHFLRKYVTRMVKVFRGFTQETMVALQSHRWPGNVRELENVVERAVVLGRRAEIGLDDLPQEIQAPPLAIQPFPLSFTHLPYQEAKDIALASFERRYFLRMMELCDHNLSQAARQAGMDRSNFRRSLKRLGYYDSQAKRVQQS